MKWSNCKPGVRVQVKNSPWRGVISTNEMKEGCSMVHSTQEICVWMPSLPSGDALTTFRHYHPDQLRKRKN